RRVDGNGANLPPVRLFWCRQVREIHATVILTLWRPVAPDGLGGATSSVWTLPSPSVARTVKVWSPEEASQSYRHCRHVSSVATSDSSHSVQGPSSTLSSTAL